MWEATQANLKTLIANKSFQSNLISFFDSVTNVVDKENMANMIFVECNTAFAADPHDILISNLEKCELDRHKTQQACITTEVSVRIQEDFDFLEIWTMTFSKDRCKVLHVGRKIKYTHTEQ